MGTLPGLDLSEGIAINDRGEVAGISYTFARGRTDHAFLYRRGKLIDLNPLLAPSGYSDSYAINNEGQVVGIFQANPLLNTPRKGFLYSECGIRVFTWPDTVGGANGAIDINDLGQVLLFHQTSDFIFHTSVRYPNGREVELTDLALVDAQPAAMNNRAQVVGTLVGKDGVQHPFLTQPGGVAPRSLGGLGGPLDAAFASAVNDLGQVVGYGFLNPVGTIEYTEHAFLYAEGKMKDLGVLDGDEGSRATGINAWGQVVGFGDNHPWVYLEGKMHDLNDLLEAADRSWTVISANGINAKGQIVGEATKVVGVGHAVVLTPTLPLK